MASKSQLHLTIVITDLNYLFNTTKGYIKLPTYNQLGFRYGIPYLSRIGQRWSTRRNRRRRNSITDRRFTLVHRLIIKSQVTTGSTSFLVKPTKPTKCGVIYKIAREEGIARINNSGCGESSHATVEA